MLRFMYAWLEIEGKQASADKSEKNIKLHFIGIMQIVVVTALYLKVFPKTRN